MRPIRRRKKDGWRPEDFDFDRWYPCRSAAFRPGSILRQVSSLANAEGELASPFVCTEINVDEKPDAWTLARPTWSSESQIMDALVSNLAVGLADGREILTVVGNSEHRIDARDRFPDTFSSCAIPPVPWPRPSIVSAFLEDRRPVPTEPLSLSQDSPRDIPGYHFRAIVSLCPRRGDEDRILKKLVLGGLLALDLEDIRACDLLFVPSFYCDGSQREPYVNVIHRLADSDRVRRTIDSVATDLGFAIPSEYRQGTLVLRREPPVALDRFREGLSLAVLSSLWRNDPDLMDPFVRTLLCVNRVVGVPQPITEATPEELAVIFRLVRSLAVKLTEGRQPITIVGSPEHRRNESADFAESRVYRRIPSAPATLLRRLCLLLSGGRSCKGKCLWVTRESPLDIPEYHVNTVVSMGLESAEQNRVYQRLADAGLSALNQQDLKACDWLLVPHFPREIRCDDVLAVSVIHRPGTSDSVNAAVDAVAAELGFARD